MSVSSIAALPPTAPIKAPDASEPKAPEVKDDPRDAQPAVVAALPPGQGTRIDQLV